jgi:6-phosphofructokinase 1
LGTAARSDPFHVREINAENHVEEVDMSDTLLGRLHTEHIDAVISIAGLRALSIIYKLHREGLRTICVPTSVENDVAATQLSFGFNTTLSFAVEMLERLRYAAQAARKIGVVEVLGEHTGWLALQSGTAVCADAVLIPEIPYDLQKVAVHFAALRSNGQRRHGLVVVAEGASPLLPNSTPAESAHPLKASLAPLATGPEGPHVIDPSGRAVTSVALELQRLTNCDTYPLVLGQLIKAGAPTAVDRQLGLGYGAAAVRAIEENLSGVMTAFVPPELTFVPLSEAINKVRTVPADSIFLQTARALGICLGD